MPPKEMTEIILKAQLFKAATAYKVHSASKQQAECHHNSVFVHMHLFA